MCPQGNTWQSMWDSSPAVPAAQQRPLFDPDREAERALHWLESMPPAAVWSELLAVGAGAALGLLRGAPAALLPAAARELDR